MPPAAASAPPPAQPGAKKPSVSLSSTSSSASAAAAAAAAPAAAAAVATPPPPPPPPPPPTTTTGSTTIKEALDRLERSKSLPPGGSSTLEKVELWGQCPPIEKMDASLGKLEACRHLALSTNSIDRITGLSGLTKLQVLSLGRNLLRSLQGVEAAAGSLEELWVSYNAIDKLAGVEKLPKLRVLLASNNRISSWAEVERLSSLTALTHLLLAGNPLATEFRDRGAAAEYRVEVLRRLPRLAKIDGLAVGAQEREAASRARVG